MIRLKRIRTALLLALVALGLSACPDTNDPKETNEGEVITTVTLSFAPQGGGTAIAASYSDPESDGNPVIDPIVLTSGADYDLSVRFLNELETPPEEITGEVDAESDQHQLFFTGTSVEGPATPANPSAVVTHAYADTDVNGFPVGLANVIATTGTGGGTFIVTLRHLPPESGNPVKTGTLAADVAAGGIEAIPGDTDVSVTFDLTVE